MTLQESSPEDLCIVSGCNQFIPSMPMSWIVDNTDEGLFKVTFENGRVARIYAPNATIATHTAFIGRCRSSNLCQDHMSKVVDVEKILE